MFGDGIWAFVVVGGFIILGAVIAYAKLKNKQAGTDDVVHRDGPPPHFGEVRKDN